MIRLLVYNVNGAVDAAAVTKVLAALRPDIACLVETPSRIGLRRIAAAVDLRTASRAGRRRLGTAVLVGERVRVLSTGQVPLPSIAGSPERAAAQAIVGAGSLRFSVIAAQLGLRPDTRLAHGLELERFVGSVDVPTVLGGDLGEPPGGVTVQRLTATLQDAFAVAGQGRGETYPTPAPTARHDFALVSPDLEIERCWVPDQPPVDMASHHRPLVVELATSDSDVDRSSHDVEHRADGRILPDTDAAEPAA